MKRLKQSKVILLILLKIIMSMSIQLDDLKFSKETKDNFNSFKVFITQNEKLDNICEDMFLKTANIIFETLKYKSQSAGNDFLYILYKSDYVDSPFNKREDAKQSFKQICFQLNKDILLKNKKIQLKNKIFKSFNELFENYNDYAVLQNLFKIETKESKKDYKLETNLIYFVNVEDIIDIHIMYYKTASWKNIVYGNDYYYEIKENKDNFNDRCKTLKSINFEISTFILRIEKKED